MSDVAQILRQSRVKGWRIATAESCTGGMIMATLTAVAGASGVVEGGFITYSNNTKISLIGVTSEVLLEHGAVSLEVAAQMALGAANRTGATLCISVTGIAGPGGSEHKPEGRVCFGLYVAGDIRMETVEFGALGRDRVRQAATDHALSLLLAASL